MLRANAGIQGWQGKPGRLPAEETLQFEKKNSSHRPDIGATLRMAAATARAERVPPGTAVCKQPRGVCVVFSAGAF